MIAQVPHPYETGEIVIFSLSIAEGTTKNSELHGSKPSPNLIYTKNFFTNAI
jgi:hypothetical protein